MAEGIDLFSSLAVFLPNLDNRGGVFGKSQGVTAFGDKGFRRFPMEGLMLYAEFGFTGGRDRTNGVAVEIGTGGTYTSPTIS